MLNRQLLAPNTILVVGGSNDITKPGGKILKNILEHHYPGVLYVYNQHNTAIQGVKTFNNLEEIPEIDLAILAIPASSCPEVVEFLAIQKSVRAFIVISGGFGEMGASGKKLEDRMTDVVTKTGGCLIGPNCIGVLTPSYAGVFTTPIPHLVSNGCDFVSGSGGTAIFIMESAIPKGIHFSRVISVGNSAQIGIEEVLEYWDLNSEKEFEMRVKLLYIESIRDPDKFLFHSRSLVNKGFRLAAIKAGSTMAGSRAATSHTGAMANSDSAVEALFRKAGIVRCYGREELTTVAGILKSNTLKGRNIAIITHAGGPAVMLTDALESGGLKIPQLNDIQAKDSLRQKLFAGSSVENPIDFLATGTAEQLGEIIDACEHDFEQIDGMAVIFGSPGLTSVKEVYQVLDQKMRICRKPIYPILPSVISVKKDLAYFLSHGNINFPDEVLLGRALTRVYQTPTPSDDQIILQGVDVPKIRQIIESCESGQLTPEKVHELLKAASIPIAKELIVHTIEEALVAAREIRFPIVMKVVGPVHKTEVNGVTMNIRSEELIRQEFNRMIAIPDTTALLIAAQYDGTELFLGAKYEPKFGHVILCGIGGIFVELLKDVTSGLAPLSLDEANSMIRNLKAYPLIKGYRGKPGVSRQKFAEIIVRLSTMLRFATEIKEMDINPLIGNNDLIVAVDVRITIEKS